MTTGGWIQPEGGERMTPAERAELSLRRYSHTLYHPVGTARMGIGCRIRRRSGASSPRGRGPAGGRRLGDADDHPRAHQCARDRDRRGRRRSDPRRALTSRPKPPGSPVTTRRARPQVATGERRRRAHCQTRRARPQVATATSRPTELTCHNTPSATAGCDRRTEARPCSRQGRASTIRRVSDRRGGCRRSGGRPSRP